VTRIVLDIDDTMWKVDHLARVMRSANSEFLSELAAQVDIQVTDARPLIVLDLKDPRQFAKFLRNSSLGGRTSFTDAADQIEAQVKPARIPEPGLWGVVEAYEFPDRRDPRRTFIHTCSEPDWPWGADGDTNHWKWDNLIDPTLIHEGLS